MNDKKRLERIDKKIAKEQRNYEGPHCCMIMHCKLLRDINVLNYDTKLHEYGIKIPKSIQYISMNYCIFCGKKISTPLRDKWFDKINKTTEEEQKDYKNLHCCIDMHYELLDSTSILKYSPSYREYGIKVPKSTGCMLMDYCLFCGTKMPKSLRHEWYDILEQEYKLENPMEEDIKQVPKEFFTDEWWKKRGL